MNSRRGPTVCAVIVTHNRLQKLKQCIEGVLAQTHRVDCVVVVDNGSEDGTNDYLRTLEKRDVRFIVVRSCANRGGAWGYWKGIVSAVYTGARWIWTLDDDAVPVDNCLEVMLSKSIPLSPGTRIGALCPKVVSEDGEIQFEHRGVFCSAMLMQVPLPNSAYQSEGVVRVGYASFVGLLINTDAVRLVGYPRKDYFLWHDDLEYSLRLRSFGFTIYMVPSATVRHMNGTQRGRRLEAEEYIRMYYDVRNTLFTARLHKLFFSMPLYASYILTRRVLAIVLFDRQKRLYRVKILLRGLIDGIRGKLSMRC